jgi:hypothetical protein
MYTDQLSVFNFMFRKSESEPKAYIFYTFSLLLINIYDLKKSFDFMSTEQAAMIELMNES